MPSFLEDFFFPIYYCFDNINWFCYLFLQKVAKYSRELRASKKSKDETQEEVNVVVFFLMFSISDCEFLLIDYSCVV